MQLATALALAREHGVARLDALLLLAWKLGVSRTWLVAHDDAELSAADEAVYCDGLRRRAAGEPLAYIIGECSFAGLRLTVNPHVLVPRPETEGLVEWAVELLQVMQSKHPAARVVDLGTGSGAIALALQARCPWARVLATDISAEALAVARGNAKRLDLAVTTAHGAWFDALGPTVNDEPFDLIVSNPPYIAADDVHLQALQHEPHTALTPGGDGLGALHAIAQGAGRHLRPGGWLLLEHGHEQATSVQHAIGAAGFDHVSTRADLAGLPRLSGGRWLGR